MSNICEVLNTENLTKFLGLLYDATLSFTSKFTPFIVIFACTSFDNENHKIWSPHTIILPQKAYYANVWCYHHICCLLKKEDLWHDDDVTRNVMMENKNVNLSMRSPLKIVWRTRHWPFLTYSVGCGWSKEPPL